MTSNPNIGFSRRLYARLVRLYPRDYRENYGPAMVQVFTDQCRAAVRQSGLRGLIVIWCRTFWDLGKTLLREHLTSPGSATGLLEAVPGRPLPWKGVVLVLAPCVVFFVGQIGQLAGQDWFFLVILRAGYFLMVPVLLVWVLTGKFPVWGLVPLGIFYHTVRNVLESMDGYLTKYGGTLLQPVQVFAKTQYAEVRVGIVLLLIVVCSVLATVIFRRQGASRSIRLWGGVFLLLLLPAILRGVYWYQQNIQYYISGGLGSQFPNTSIVLRDIISMSYYDVAYMLEYLLLILAGALLARRHGRLALLLPLGFIMPFVLVGRYDDTQVTTTFLIWTSAVVLVYRVLVTIVAPVWIVRSASDGRTGRIGAIVFISAMSLIVITHLVFWMGFLLNPQGNPSVSLSAIYYDLSPTIIVIVGVALAISLYQRKPAEQPAGSGVTAEAIPA
jgi:hypothetical protein